jgi:apolipoprotein N-acyltransferase
MVAYRELLQFLAARPRMHAAALGALAAFGFEPLHLWPLTLLALAGLIGIVARAGSWRRALMAGWLFGAVHFTVGNNWIATAFTYQAEMPVWLGWVAVVLLSLYLAVWPALAALAAWMIARQGQGRVGVALAGTWIITEWLRAWVFTGFAWNPLGAVLLGGYETPGLAVLTPWIGTYGLSGLVVVLAAILRRALCASLGAAAARMRQSAWYLIPAALLVTGGMMVPATWLPREQGTLAYTLVQPDVRQEVLDDPREFENRFRRTARLSLPLSPGQARLVLWPESGVPDYLRGGYPQSLYDGITYASDPVLARARIGRVIGANSLLLTGAVDLVIRDGQPVAAHNVITALDARGSIRGSYAKAHLVPYGEYLALRWLLEPLGATRLVPGALDFWPGPGPRTVDLGPWGKAGMQICYEIIFSGEVVEPGKRPDYVFNPSNDGWFGSWGPPQHLAQARLRAIEEGLPVLRATTTGISAVIDANGIVRQHAPRHHARRLDGMMPPAHAPSLFARFGNALPLALAALLLLASRVALWRRSG